MVNSPTPFYLLGKDKKSFNKKQNYKQTFYALSKIIIHIKFI